MKKGFGCNRATARAERRALPIQHKQRNPLSRQREFQISGVVVYHHGLGSFELCEISSGFECLMLHRSKVVWRTHLLPKFISVAVARINAVVGECGIAVFYRKMIEGNVYECVRAGEIVIVIVPYEDRQAFLIERGESGDIGL